MNWCQKLFLLAMLEVVFLFGSILARDDPMPWQIENDFTGIWANFAFFNGLFFGVVLFLAIVVMGFIILEDVCPRKRGWGDD